MIDDDEMIRHCRICVQAMVLHMTQLEHSILIALFTIIKYLYEIAIYTLKQYLSS
jgi:hypothetical protein